MGSLQTFFDRMGSNFLVAGLIPALGFITAIMFTFESVLPDSLKKLIGGTFNPLSEEGIITLLFTAILGYTITSLNTFFLKIFEGYILIWRFPFLRWAELKRFKKARYRIQQIKKKIAWLERMPKNRSRAQLLEQLYDQEVRLVTEFEYAFPPDERDVMPFRFGNTLKAAESYPSLRYHIDAVPLWTRLIHVIPQSYDTKIEHSHNQLSFLVNCTVFSATFSLICFSASIYRLIIKADPAAYFFSALVGSLVTLIFNRASVLSVDEFGDMIRGSFDLFRMDLFRQFHLKPPADSEAESVLWQRISRFINVGYAIGKTLKFEYDFKPEDIDRKQVEVQQEPQQGNNK